MRFKNYILFLIIVFFVLTTQNFSFGQEYAIRITDFGLNDIAQLQLDDFFNPALYPLEIETKKQPVDVKLKIIWEISTDKDGTKRLLLRIENP